MRSVRDAWRDNIGLSIVSGVLVCLGLAALLYFDFGAENATAPSGSVQVAGSESMRPAVAACAEDFMVRNPRTDIIVRGGGSGDGIAALLHGLVDVGMTSRDLSQREREYAASKAIEFLELPLASDGIAIIVNRANPVTELNLGQLQAIFAGQIRNWRDLRGDDLRDDLEIRMFARASGSGTASLFGDRVLGEMPPAASVEYLPANEAIVAQVAALPGAIGYTGFAAMSGARERIKVVALRTDQQSTADAATTEAIRSGRYPLARTLYFVAQKQPSETARAFLDFCLSARGQELVQRAGFIGIGPTGR